MSKTTPETSKAGRITMTMAGNLKMKDCILISPLPTGIMVGAFVIKVETYKPEASGWQRDGVEITVAAGDGRKRAYHLESTDCVPVVEF